MLSKLSKKKSVTTKSQQNMVFTRFTVLKRVEEIRDVRENLN